jgi:hypothetical protein
MPIYKKDGKAVLFVHVPKVGGTTIDHIFRSNGWLVTFQDGGGQPDTILRHLKCSFQHFHADLLTQFLNPDSFDAVFTVLRDPLARLQSEYLWRRQHAQQPVSDFNTWTKEMFSRYRFNRFLLDNHIRPQCEFILPGAQVTVLEAGLARVFEKLSETLNMPFRYDETRVHNASISEAEIEISARTVRRIRRFYARDFRLHNRHG